MVPSLSFTFAHALRVSTGVPTSLPDQSAMVVSSRGCDRGRGRGRFSGEDVSLASVITVVGLTTLLISGRTSLADLTRLNMLPQRALLVISLCLML